MSSAARWFPLVPRWRPRGAPLSERVEEIAGIARSLGRGDTAPGAPAQVYNGAALIASDVGMHQRARAWCWEHTRCYLPRLPVDGIAAQKVLEPLVNLARLRVRTGDGVAAFDILSTLFTGVDNAEEVVIDGCPVPLDRLTADADDRHKVRSWLWAVLLGDGTRALASDGRWAEAAAHAGRANGIGSRLLDGRQAAVIAHLHAGDADGARSMVEDSTVPEPWEFAVQECLRTMCATARGNGAANAAAAMMEAIRTLPHMPERAVFRTRLLLAAADLADAAGHPGGADLAACAAEEAITSDDAYAARDVRAARVDALPDESSVRLDALLRAARLDTGEIPEPYLARLNTAVRDAGAAIGRSMQAAG